ncbi:MAG TPA: hypothetical protein VFU15_16055, partial [Bacteroidia bacterium]|nr:hypothetical protein [Bacteroidia bacterium]
PMRGFFCIQFIEDDGAYYLTDVNPRIGGGSILSLHCSDSMRSNLVAILKNEHEKIKPSIGAYREESMFRYYQEYYV